jgi:mannosylfructose-phosphate synthase
MSDKKINRIAHLSVHGYFDPEPFLGQTDTGGQVTYVLELAKHLGRLGHKVDIFTRQFEGRERIAPVDDNVRVVRLPCGPDSFIRKEDIFPHWDEYVQNVFAFLESENLQYDVWHGHYWDAGYVSMKVTDKIGQPFFYTAHSLGAWKKEQMGGDPVEMEKLFKFEERLHWENIIFRKARAHTVTTEDGMKTYKRLYGFETPDMDIIPPGVDVERFRPLRDGETDVEITVPDRYVFALSRIDSNKGHVELLRAFSHVRKDCPDVHLVIGGGSTNPKQHEIDVKNSFLSVVDELELADSVIFTGYIPDEEVVAYYRNAEIFVLPSKYEPFGMTTTEAMSCGTPVVVTKFGGIRRDLTEGTDALLANVSDEDEFGAVITRLLQDRQLHAKLAAGALKTAHEKFSWDGIARRHMAFYERYIDSP